MAMPEMNRKTAEVFPMRTRLSVRKAGQQIANINRGLDTSPAKNCVKMRARIRLRPPPSAC
jgi:hypothetical protein